MRAKRNANAKRQTLNGQRTTHNGIDPSERDRPATVVKSLHLTTFTIENSQYKLEDVTFYKREKSYEQPPKAPTPLTSSRTRRSTLHASMRILNDKVRADIYATMRRPMKRDTVGQRRNASVYRPGGRKSRKTASQRWRNRGRGTSDQQSSLSCANAIMQTSPRPRPSPGGEAVTRAHAWPRVSLNELSECTSASMQGMGRQLSLSPGTTQHEHRLVTRVSGYVGRSVFCEMACVPMQPDVCSVSVLCYALCPDCSALCTHRWCALYLSVVCLWNMGLWKMGLWCTPANQGICPNAVLIIESIDEYASA